MGENDRKGRIAVYTVLVGGYDTLRRPKFIDAKCDYYCLTDDLNIKSDIWNIKYLDNSDGLDCTRLSRLPKILPHVFFPEYEESIYVDPNLEIRASLVEYISTYRMERPMLCMKHIWRDCIYDEADECIRLSKDDQDVIEHQMQFFRKKGFPKHYGLTQNSVLYRRHHDKTVIRVMEDWWEIVRTGSKRDQLSFNYVCWKNDFQYDLAFENWLDTKYFRRYPHIHEAFVYPSEGMGKVYYSFDGIFREANSFSVKSPLINLEQNQQFHDPNKTLPLAYRFEEIFDLPANTLKARFDPLQGSPCILKDFSAYIGDLRLAATFSNGIEIDEFVYFDTAEPQIILDFPDGSTGLLNISYDIYLFPYPDDWKLASKAVHIDKERKLLLQLVAAKNGQQAELPAVLLTVRDRLALNSQLEKQHQELLQQYQEILNSFIWRFTKPLRIILDEIKRIRKSVSGKLKRFCEISKSKRAFAAWMISKEISRFIPDRPYIKLLYRAYMDEKLDLRNPRTYNQKLQWLKLYDRNPLHTQLTDKYAVRKFVEQRVGVEYLVPLLGVYPSFDAIDFSALPQRFVLKTTHDSGGVVICDNPENFNKKAAAEKLNTHLSQNYYYWGREWNYKNIHPQIIAEKYLEDAEHGDLFDYKFMCFDGRAKCCLVCANRQKSDLNITFFDLDWNVLPFYRHYPQSMEPIAKPKRLKDMVLIAEKLSSGIPFVRVDLYTVNDDIYFGEMTFHPGSGLSAFTPPEWDYKIGEWMDLRQAYHYTKRKKNTSEV